MLKPQAIELLGGSIAAAASAIGVSYQAVDKWPETLPDRIVDRVVAALVRQGKAIPPELLAVPAPPEPCIPLNTHAAHVIDKLGGTAEVARLFDLSMPSVSDWKKDGIPSARMMFLRAVKQQELEGVDLDAATAPRRKAIPEEAKAA